MKTIVCFLVVALFAAAVPIQAADVTVPSGSYTIKKTASRTLAFGAADTTKSFTLETNLWLHSAVVTLPNWTNAVTATFSVTNSDSKEIYSAAALAESTDHVLQDFADFGFLPLTGTSTVTVTLSGVPGGSGGSATVILYLFEK